MQTNTDSRTAAAERLHAIAQVYADTNPTDNTRVLVDTARTLMERGWMVDDECRFLDFLARSLAETDSQLFVHQLLRVHRAYLAWVRVDMRK